MNLTRFLNEAARSSVLSSKASRGKIVQYSDGFPYYTHLYGLHCARRAIRDGTGAVTIEHFERALDEILADCDLARRQAYELAAETSGEVRVRKTVMEAM